MAKRIVDALEMIEIEEDQRHLRTLALGRRQQLLAAVAQQPAVRQPGQRIEIGQLAGPLLGFLLRRDVEQGTDRGRLSLVGRWRAEDHDRHRRPVLAQPRQLVGLALLAGGASLHLIEDDCALLGNDQILGPQTVHQFVLRVADQVDQKRIDVTEHALLQDEDADLSGFHRRPELRLLFAHGDFGSDAPADIDRDAQCGTRPAGGIGLDHHRVVTMPNSPLGIDQSIIDGQRHALSRATRRGFDDTRHRRFVVARQKVAPDQLDAGFADTLEIHPEQAGGGARDVFEAASAEIEAIDDAGDAVEQLLVERQFFVFFQTTPSSA